MSNKVLITNDQNVVKVPSGLRILIRRSCNAVLDFEHFDGPAEISVTFVDNNRIHELNKEYRDKDSATDVLSFPLGENGEYDIDEDNGCKLLGDIVISMERAMEQAELYGHSLQREVAYLTVHSMLHLLGYDHEAGGLEAVRMREKALLFLREEVPHGIAVVVERFKERPDKDLIDIDVDIYCERKSHKGMIIGKGGQMLKKIASAARMDIEELLGVKVNLQCWVKVREDWRDNELQLNSLGFAKP